jgi:hypothetical protein
VNRLKTGFSLSVGGLVLMGSQSSVNACSVCFGDPDSGMTRGAFAGVMVMFGIIATVLGGVIFTAAYWTQRSRKLSGFIPEDLH